MFFETKPELDQDLYDLIDYHCPDNYYTEISKTVTRYKDSERVVYVVVFSVIEGSEPFREGACESFYGMSKESFNAALKATVREYEDYLKAISRR
ncbi:hypothetical protein [Xanthocytophaga flava]|uniref:hypothetical protein n=1 Tax=Xanthocytophaga flava TaxID=3048013 RepID=UPI0028D3C2D9|nr:hypothetical protein [Xanthocytophaga flavus]MDJ1468185.1 hypothetical protein [Xanthocytophaga flavus]